MELYTSVAYDLSRQLTRTYSTSFSLASRLYTRSLRQHIYAIYGMVRLADEIVDTYVGDDKAAVLQAFEDDVMATLISGYSANPIVHAFTQTARTFAITGELIEPFFASMRMDLTKTTFSNEEYSAYIYGSAEVVGLMCLRLFCNSDQSKYDALTSGARALGSAYQKVNFLRDLSADYVDRGRVYFPGVSYDAFDDAVKTRIIAEIEQEFITAAHSINQLPRSARRSVRASYRYYHALLRRLRSMSAADIKQHRAHVSSVYKMVTFATGAIGL